MYIIILLADCIFQFCEIGAFHYTDSTRYILDCRSKDVSIVYATIIIYPMKKCNEKTAHVCNKLSLLSLMILSLCLLYMVKLITLTTNVNLWIHTCLLMYIGLNIGFLQDSRYKIQKRYLFRLNTIHNRPIWAQTGNIYLTYCMMLYQKRSN